MRCLTQFIFANIFKKKITSSQNSRHFRTAIQFLIKNKYNLPLKKASGKKLKKHVIEKNDNQSRVTTKITIGASITCLVIYVIYTFGRPEIDHFGLPIQDDLSGKPVIIQYLIRSCRELQYYLKLMKAPSKEKLLPDPLPYPYLQPKYTLVLELTDVLVHSEWTYNTGWRYKKRPLLNYFLESLQGTYEIVVYTAEQGIVVFPLIEAIDPKKIIAHKLVRDATYFTGGLHVKALDKLNRHLSKVICVDWNAKNVKFNPDNLFNIKRWTGNDNDTSLLDLASFLKTIAANDIEDVRDVLKYYSQYEDPVEAYKEKQKRLIEELEEQAAAERQNEEQ